MATAEVPRRLLALQISEEQLRSVPKPVFVNTVATYSMGSQKLSAELLTLLLPGFCYNPQRFAAIKMRLSSRSMILGFCRGIAVCPGSRDVESARIAGMRFTHLLLQTGFYVEFSRFNVENIVMSVYTPFEIYLPDIRERYTHCTSYKSGNFPGLAFRMNGDTKIVFNIFVTGRVVITGSKSAEHSYRAWWWLYTNVLLQHRMKSAPGTTSSASFRINTHRRSHRLSDHLSHISSRHAHRESGSTRFGDQFGAATPMRTPQATPSTPRMAHMQSPSQLRGASLYFYRMQNTFSGHSLACPFVRADPDEALALADYVERARHYESTRDAKALLQEHCDAGCFPASVVHSDALLSTYADKTVRLLHNAIGERRVRVAVVDDPPLAAHSTHCRLVADASTIDYGEVLRDVEIALAALVDGDAAPASTVLDACRSAQCQLGADEDNEHCVRALAASLQMCVNDDKKTTRSSEPAAVDGRNAYEWLEWTDDDFPDPERMNQLECLHQAARHTEQVAFTYE